MRQLIRRRREKEPHLSCGSCLSEATFTRSGWAALESITLIGVGVQAGSPQGGGQTLGPKGCAGYGGEAKTWLWSKCLL